MSEHSETFETCSTTIINVQVDWITFTVKQPDERAALRALADTMLAEAYRNGRPVRSFAWMGYQGQQTEGLRYGERADSAIFITYSDWCAGYWRLLRGIQGRATRLDLAVDFYVDPEHNSDLTEWLYKACDEAWKSDRVYSIVNSSDGGSTFYAGSRKSGRMMRVYNKSVQSGNPLDVPTVWRAELELKGKKAESAYRSLLRQSDPDAFCTYAVRSQLMAWYLPLQLRASTILMNATLAKLHAAAPGKTLTWLKLQVAPSIARLIDYGRLEDVERALGYRLVSF